MKIISGAEMNKESILELSIIISRVKFEKFKPAVNSVQLSNSNTLYGAINSIPGVNNPLSNNNSQSVAEDEFQKAGSETP